MQKQKGNVYGRLQMTDWLDEDVPEGPNRIALEIFRELKDIDKRMARNNIILFFLLTKYNMTDMRQMMVSTRRQRDLIEVVKKRIKGYTDKHGVEHPGHAITEDWVPVFVRNIKSLKRRANHIFSIIRVDLEETELYPYFTTVGFERLIDFSVRYYGAQEEQVEQLQKEIDEWNAQHREAVDNYMASIAERIANREARKKKIEEDNKAEKEARRLARKMATAEAREIRENERKHRIEEHRVNRMFDRYWS